MLSVNPLVLTVILGFGENVRGTALGAVDTVAHEEVNKGDAVAQTGRNEMSEGLSNMGSRAASASQASAQYPGSNTGNSSMAAPGNAPPYGTSIHCLLFSRVI